MGDEHSFYVFLFLPWKKMFSVKISFVVRGRQAFFLHFLASSMDDELSFFILLSSEPSDECSFFVFRSSDASETRFFLFFLHGVISNAQRVERSTNFLIMKKRKSCRRPRPCGGCSCPACESIARQRQRICRAIARRLALDSFRLKSTEDQGENWTSQHRGRSLTSIIRNITRDGCFQVSFYLQ